MPTIIRSGTKITIFGGSALLAAIALLAKVPIQVGNEFVKTSVSVPATFWSQIWHLIFG